MNVTPQQLQDLLEQGFRRNIKLVERRPNLLQLHVPYFYPDGDMVEILVDKKRAKPSEEWLNKVQTNLARDKIKQSLKKSNFNKLFQIFNR